MFLWMMIQILIESLPISSSGHVQLMHLLCSKFGWAVDLSKSEMIDFLLHGPALVIMLCYFWPAWWKMIFGGSKDLLSALRSAIKPAFFVIIADIVTFAWWYSGVAKFEIVPKWLLACGFTLTAAMLLATRFLHDKKNVFWSPKNAAILGFAQGFALLPGVSRFATTFFVGRCLGYKLEDSFALSFLIQCPLVLAAFLKGVLAARSDAMFLQFFDFWMLFGIVGMSFVSYLLLSLVGKLICRNRVWYFSVYMLLPIAITVLL